MVLLRAAGRIGMLFLRRWGRIGTWAFAAAGLSGVGCYKPSIDDGGFRCAPAPEKRCPDGYSCEASTGTCRVGSGGDDAGPIDRPSIDLPGEMAVDVPGEKACVAPVPNCTPMTGGKCDPVCQTGCTGCAEQCSVNGVGALTCNAPLGGAIGLGKSCDISAAGSPTQTDNCAPGLVCLNEGCGMHCFRHCRIDADCVNATCSRQIGGGHKVCEVPFVTCNPMETGVAAGCPAMAHACYVSALLPDKTFCDCPGAAVGENGACSSPQDCFRGLVCVDASNSMDFRCRRVCNLSGVNNCPNRSCRPIRDSKMYGFCN